MLDTENMFCDPDYPHDNIGKIEILLPSGGHELNAMLLNAAGGGLRPVAILLHGFPGNERNLDLAESLRAAGCHTLFFHYRGAWGSRGMFTFENVLEDAENAVAFFKNPVNAAKYGIDPDLIFLVGHSMGGFAAITALAARDDFCGAVAIAPYDFAAARAQSENCPDFLENYNAVVRCPLPPLRLEYEDVLHDELTRHMSDWQLPSKAAALAGKQLCILAFDRDVVSQAALHLDPLVAAYTPVMGDGFEVHRFDTDHGYNSRRYGVAKCVATWIAKKCPVSAK